MNESEERSDCPGCGSAIGEHLAAGTDRRPVKGAEQPGPRLILLRRIRAQRVLQDAHYRWLHDVAVKIGLHGDPVTGGDRLPGNLSCTGLAFKLQLLQQIPLVAQVAAAARPNDQGQQAECSKGRFLSDCKT